MKEYNINLDLESGASLKMLLFDSKEHRWIFEYRYVFPDSGEKLEEPKLINDTKLVVNYENGAAQDIRLTMNTIRRDRVGKKFYLGVDISKNSKLCIEFLYEKKDDLYRLNCIDLGLKRGKIDLSSQKEGLVKPFDFPFPIKDRIENEFGEYKVPFLRKNGEEAFFEFPKNYRKKI